jgi:hypothetical protein
MLIADRIERNGFAGAYRAFDSALTHPHADRSGVTQRGQRSGVDGSIRVHELEASASEERREQDLAFREGEVIADADPWTGAEG